MTRHIKPKNQHLVEVNRELARFSNEATKRMFWNISFRFIYWQQNLVAKCKGQKLTGFHSMLFRCCTFSLQPYAIFNSKSVQFLIYEVDCQKKKKIVSISFHSRAFETLEGHETSKTAELSFVQVLLYALPCVLVQSSMKFWNIARCVHR